MYSNTSYDYGYDLEVELKGSKTGEILTKFNARELNTQNFDASFASGGIASGGQSYTIATNEDLSKYKKQAYSIQAFVDGVEYKVLNITSYINNSRMLGSYKNKREYVLYLG